MGGTSVLIFSALHPELVAGIISENGTANLLKYENFQDAIAASYGGNKQKQPGEYRKRSPELTPKQFTMPVAFTVGGKDASVPPDSVRRLAKRLQDMKREVLLIDHRTSAIRPTATTRSRPLSSSTAPPIAGRQNRHPLKRPSAGSGQSSGFHGHEVRQSSELPAFAGGDGDLLRGFDSMSPLVESDFPQSHTLAGLSEKDEEVRIPMSGVLPQEQELARDKIGGRSSGG
jgi:hypothetical protein